MRSKEKNVANVMRWINNNREKWNTYQRKRTKIRRDGFKKRIFELLGNKCSNPNCLVPNGCTDIRCLQIDHVHGGVSGERARKHHGSTEKYLRHIFEEIKAGSKDYQLLCANCNWIKRVENHET